MHVRSRPQYIIIDITIKEGETVVSDGKVHEKIVGEKVSLTAEILPSDLTVTSKKWTVPENRVKNYNGVDLGFRNAAL